MVYDYSKLRGLIREKLGSEKVLAEKIKRDRSTLSQKMNNRVDFTSEEIFKISHILGISDNQIGLYFLLKKLRNSNYKKRCEKWKSFGDGGRGYFGMKNSFSYAR